MRPLTLTLEGFQGYRDSQHVDLTQVDRASITGRVGAGKSTLLDSIVFSLFGKVRVPTMDGVIHTACAKATTEMEFAEGDGRYKVSRTLTRSGNSKAYLWRWDEDTYEWVTLGDQDGRVKETSNAIRDLIGLSWDAFRASVIVEQGNSAGFAQASAPDRYALLSQIVGLDQYARYAESAGEQRKAVRLAITQAQARIDEQTGLLADAERVAAEHTSQTAQHIALVAALDTLAAATTAAEKDEQLARARLDLAQQQAHVATARAAADQTLTQARRHEAEARTLVESLTRTASTLDAARAHHAAAERAKTAADATTQNLIADGERARDALTAALAAHARATEEIAVLTERLAGLGHAADGCFTCGQALSAVQRAKVISDLTRERGDLTARAAALDQQIKDATASRASAATAYRQASAAANLAQTAVNDATRPIQDAERASQALPEATARIVEATASVNAAAAARQALEGGDDANLPQAQDVWTKAQANVARCRAAHDAAKQNIGVASTNIAVLADRMDRHDAGRAAIKSLTADVATARIDEAGWTRLIEAYSPAGVPRMILDTAIADINIDLDAELGSLSGGALTASLDTMRATKGGAMKSEITLTVVGQDGARVYESFSGGQRFLVDLALHLALTKTLARRNGSALDFIAIDEGWGAIEGEEREAVLRALHELASEHGALLLAITHVAEVADSFPTRIETEMISGTSITTVR